MNKTILCVKMLHIYRIMLLRVLGGMYTSAAFYPTIRRRVQCKSFRIPYVLWFCKHVGRCPCVSVCVSCDVMNVFPSQGRWSGGGGGGGGGGGRELFYL